MLFTMIRHLFLIEDVTINFKTIIKQTFPGKKLRGAGGDPYGGGGGGKGGSGDINYLTGSSSGTVGSNSGGGDGGLGQSNDYSGTSITYAMGGAGGGVHSMLEPTSV